MQVIRDQDQVPAEFQKCVLALGNFDGVHRGHQTVLGVAQDVARQTDANPTHAKVGVLTFAPHPQLFFRPNTKMFALSPEQRKLALFEAFGLDFATLVTFDRKFSEQSAETFVTETLCGRWKVSHVVIGYNFFFGKGRSGNAHMLTEAGKAHGFDVTIVAPASQGGDVYSSSAARSFLRAGQVREAADVLGHWWAVQGIVEKGAQIGRTMGYPTVNVMLEMGQDLAAGIYAARVTVGGRRYDGAAYNGRRPTFDNGVAKLEVFLFDFSGDLYGTDIVVELIDFIRPDQAFENMEALKIQMDDDCATARKILDEVNAADPMEAFPIGRALAEAVDRV